MARLLAKLGFHPNTITFLGLLLAVGAGWLASQGAFTRSGVVYLVAGAMDGIDGALARALGRVSRFGAVLDSVLDRYGEAALLAGLAYWTAKSGRLVDLMLIFATVVGSLMVSYVRARAEGLGLDLKIGLLTRVERYLLVLLMLFTGKLTIGLAVIAALSNFTVIQRVARVYRLTREDLV
jgi:CDP-diacylglycerol--glycerol-3-phosphate 3-phosphatidyltransferase